MSGYTKGPWVLIDGNNIYSALGADSGDGIPADSTDGWHIASIGETPTFVDGDEVDLGRNVKQANARLIAAAPDLLEALMNAEKMLSELDYIGEITQLGKDHLASMRAAIDRAKGVQQ